MSPSDLPAEIEHFFDVYKKVEKKKSAVEGWEDAETARRVITEARERYRSGLQATENG